MRTQLTAFTCTLKYGERTHSSRAKNYFKLEHLMNAKKIADGDQARLSLCEFFRYPLAAIAYTIEKNVKKRLTGKLVSVIEKEYKNGNGSRMERNIVMESARKKTSVVRLLLGSGAQKIRNETVSEVHLEALDIIRKKGVQEKGSETISHAPAESSVQSASSTKGNNPFFIPLN